MKLRTIIGYGMLALLTILYFVPKENLYYQLEHILQPYGIVIHNEHLDDKKLWLEITQAKLYVKKLESMQIEKTRIMLFGIHNQIDLQGITLASTLGQFVPNKIETAKLSHTFYDPLNITGEISGKFGQAEVNFDLYNKVFSAKIEPSKLMKYKFRTTLENFTRDAKGVYQYEYRF